MSSTGESEAPKVGDKLSEPLISEEELLALFECGFCLETVAPPLIGLCENGHNICNHCHSKVTNCPNCQVAINEIYRNLTLEKLAPYVTFPKVQPKDQLPNFPCPLFDWCKWEGPKEQINWHLQIAHKEMKLHNGESVEFVRREICIHNV